MASLTSFESFFGNVFNATPTSRKHKVKRQNIAHRPHKPVDIKDFEVNQKEDKHKNKNKIGGIKISSYKLKQSKAHRKNSINAQKNELQSNLISLGYNPQNMSLMKQRKLFDKAMKELSSRKNPNEQDANEKEKEKKEDDILSFMKDNDLFINDKNKQTAPKKPRSSTQKQAESRKDAMDIEFGDVVKPEYKKVIDEETFIRTGKSNKEISDRHLLISLKKRDKAIKKRYHNRVHIDDHLASNVMKKIKGETVKNDLNYMKNKMKQKYKKKMRSRKQWKQRLARKEYGTNKKLDRRDANIAAYRDKKTAKRMRNRITTQQAIAAANM